MKTRKKISGVGVVIRRFRHWAGLSQDALADRMDLSTSYISMLEGGKRYPSIEMLIRLAIALEVTPGVILDRIAERYTPNDACFPWGNQPKKKDLTKIGKELDSLPNVSCSSFNTSERK